MGWDNVEEMKPESGPWGKLKEGINYLRIVSEPSGFRSHYNPSTKKSSVCTSTKTELCDSCKAGNKPSSRFIMNAFELVMKDGKFTGEKILKHYEFPYSIINMLEGYRVDPEYKYDSVPNWDTNIKKEVGSEPKDVKYFVIPARKDRPLSAEEKSAIEGFETPDEMVAKKSGVEKPTPDASKAVTATNVDDELPPVKDEAVPDPEGDESIDLNSIPF